MEDTLELRREMKLKAVEGPKGRKLLSMSAAWVSVSREHLLVELNLLSTILNAARSLLYRR